MNIYQESIETLYEIKDNITDEEFDILNGGLRYLRNELKKLDKPRDFLEELRTHKKKIDTKRKRKGCHCSEDDLCLTKSRSDLKKCRNFNKFLELNPVIGVLYGKEMRMFLEPVLMIGQDLEPIRKNLMNIIHQVVFSDNEMRLIMVVALCDYMLKNIYLMIEDNNVAKSVNQIIEQYFYYDNIREFFDKLNMDVFKIRKSFYTTVRPD